MKKKFLSIVALTLLTTFSSSAFSEDNYVCESFVIDSQNNADSKSILEKMIEDINSHSSVKHKLNENNICGLLTESEFSKVLDITVEEIESENQESIERELTEGKIEAAMEAQKK